MQRPKPSACGHLGLRERSGESGTALHARDAFHADGMHPVLHADCEAAFDVPGPAELTAVENGNFASHAPYARTSGRLFHGALSAVIRLTGDGGTVRVKASSGEDLKGEAEICVIV